MTLPDAYSAQWPRRKLKAVAPGAPVFGLISDITLAEAGELVRSWGAWLDARGVIRIAHTPTLNEAEFRKRRRGIAKGSLVFRFRNDDVSRRHFATVLERLRAERVQFELELTPKLRRHRAIRIPIDVPQELVGQAALRLLRLTLNVQDSDLVQLGCAGQMVPAASGPKEPLLHLSPAFSLGVKVGRAMSKLVR